MPVCEYCNKNFYDKSTLNKHQKDSKSCMKIRLQKDPNLVIEKIEFKCKYCEKKLSCKRRLETHINICKKKDEKKINTSEITEMKAEIKLLKKELEKVKDNPKQIINNTVNNTINNYGSILTFMTPEVVLDTFKKLYDISIFLQSDKGLANFTTKHFLTGKNKPYYICVDKARKKFIFTDENKKKIEDVDAGILIGLISNGMSVVTKFYEQHRKTLQKKLLDSSVTNNQSLIEDIYDQIIKLEKIYKSIKDTINKQKPERYCSQLARRLPSCIEDREVLDRLTNESNESDDSDDEKIESIVNELEPNYEYDENIEIDKQEFEKVIVDEKAISAEEYLEKYYNESDSESDSERCGNEREIIESDNIESYNPKMIGGITLGGLKMYKDFYKKSNIVKFHPKFVKTSESLQEYQIYLDN